MSRVLYIVNSAGQGGGGTKVWNRFESQWPDRIAPEDVRFTRRRGHAREMAAAADGYDVLVAVGGDGTTGEVLSGIMERAEPHPKLAIIPAGTGNDIARHIGVYPVDKAVSALQGNRTQTHDLMRIECRVDDGPAFRYAFLYANAGFSPMPLFKPWMKRLLGANVGSYLAMILALFAYRPRKMAVRWAQTQHTGHTWTVVAGNTERVAGGSMCIAPGARTDDGEFNVSIIPATWKLRKMIAMLCKVPKGKHVNAPGVLYFSTTEIEVQTDRPVLVEIDGDVFGTTPATFTVCPAAIEIVC